MVLSLFSSGLDPIGGPGFRRHFMEQHFRIEAFGISAPPSPSIYSVESVPRGYLTPMDKDSSDVIARNPARHSLSQAGSDPVSPPDTSGSSSAIQAHRLKQTQRYFHSRRIKKGEIEHPWKTAKKDPREKWITIIPLIGLALGFAIAGFLLYDGLRTIVNHKYDLILDEDWSQGFRTDIWHKEVTVGGFG